MTTVKATATCWGTAVTRKPHVWIPKISLVAADSHNAGLGPSLLKEEDVVAQGNASSGLEPESMGRKPQLCELPEPKWGLPRLWLGILGRGVCRREHS